MRPDWRDTKIGGVAGNRLAIGYQSSNSGLFRSNSSYISSVVRERGMDGSNSKKKGAGAN